MQINLTHNRDHHEIGGQETVSTFGAKHSLERSRFAHFKIVYDSVYSTRIAIHARPLYCGARVLHPRKIAARGTDCPARHRADRGLPRSLKHKRDRN